MDDVDIIKKFESIGDTCEFGFVQRHFGLEPISLLRWAGSSFSGLVKGLEHNFVDIFRLEDIEQGGAGLVRDKKYAISFHCSLAFDEHGLKQDDENLKKFRSSLKDIRYRLRLFKEGLADRDKIYVYKNNNGLTLKQILRLKAAIDLGGPQKLLCVVPASNEYPKDHVELLGSGIKIAGATRLAPYNRQEDIDAKGWLSICEKALLSDWGHHGTEVTPESDIGPPKSYQLGLVLKRDNSMVVSDANLATALATALYRTILLREPDSGGLTNNVDSTLRKGYTIEDIITHCLKSPEFKKKSGAFLEHYCGSSALCANDHETTDPAKFGLRG